LKTPRNMPSWYGITWYKKAFLPPAFQ